MYETTIAGFIARLQQYPGDALCCGTFWLTDDFLALDSTLTEDEIAAAMSVAQHGHDANIGFNWATLQYAIDQVKG